jgi:hypothetical protein
MSVAAFYAIEATLHRGFVDPVGPADLPGFNSTPMLAACEIETGFTTNTTLNASDEGYRTRSTDPSGVVAYPPLIAQAFQVDISVNLDPTASSVAAAWGSLTLTNIDHSLDPFISGWQTDGQPVCIYRGEKTYDPVNNLWIDPPYASLVKIFNGVMGPWLPVANQVSVALRDATYYLEKPVPRTLYSGTGGINGTVDLAGVAAPIMLAGSGDARTVGFLLIQNVTPLLIDPANLVYQFSSGMLVALVTNAYDGGVPLTWAGLVPNVYTTVPAAGNFIYDNTGLLRLGSKPTFALTIDANNSNLAANIQIYLYWVLTNFLGVPDALIGSQVGSPGVGFPFTGLTCMQGVSVYSNALASAIQECSSLYVGPSESIDGLTVVSDLIGGTGALLVPSRDGRLRLFVITAIPSGTPSVLTFDDSNTVSVTPVALPTTVDPPPSLMRLAWGRNWTVQTTQLGGAITAARQAFVSTAMRVVSWAAAVASSAVARPTQPNVIGLTSGAAINSLSNQNNIMFITQFWGVKRRLYEVVAPASVGLNLDWGSVVTLVSNFDVLRSPGMQGQIVGWRYSSGDSTATFRVLV